MILLYILNCYTNCSADSFNHITQGIAKKKKDHTNKYVSNLREIYSNVQKYGVGKIFFLKFFLNESHARKAAFIWSKIQYNQ